MKLTCGRRKCTLVQMLVSLADCDKVSLAFTVGLQNRLSDSSCCVFVVQTAPKRCLGGFGAGCFGSVQRFRCGSCLLAVYDVLLINAMSQHREVVSLVTLDDVAEFEVE